MLSGVCGHDRVHGERHRASCPTCGATLRSFALYRDLQARR
jgi:rubrerythrin